MNIDVTKPQSVSFFVPVGMGVLAQMFCVGLLMALMTLMTRGSTSSGPRNTLALAAGPTEIANPQPTDTLPNSSSIPKHEAPSAASTESAAPPEPDADAPLDLGHSDPAEKSATPPAAGPSEIAAASGDTPTDAQPIATGKPLDDVRIRSRKLPLAGEGVPDEIALCLIRASDPTKVDLELLGGEFSEPQGLKVQLDPPSQAEQSYIWNVAQVSAAGFDRNQNIGEFQLKDERFSFRWLKDADKGKLPFCRLKISADADTEVCDLWSSVHPPALRVSFSNSKQKMAPFVVPGVELPPVELLQLELMFEGWPEHATSGDTLVLNEPMEMLFPEDGSDRNLLKIELILKMEGGQLAVEALHSTNVPKLPARNDKGEVIYSEKRLSHNELEKFTKDVASAVEKYQRELNTFDEELEKSQTGLDNLDRQLEKGFVQALSNQRDLRQRQKEKIEEQQAVSAGLFDTFSEAQTAMKTLSELCEEIEKTGRIHYRLIRSMGALGSEIVISSSVDAGAEQAGRVP